MENLVWIVMELMMISGLAMTLRETYSRKATLGFIVSAVCLFLFVILLGVWAVEHLPGWK